MWHYHLHVVDSDTYNSRAACIAAESATPDKKNWTDNRISDFPDISDIVDFRPFYKSIWDQDQS